MAPTNKADAHPSDGECPVRLDDGTSTPTVVGSCSLDGPDAALCDEASTGQTPFMSSCTSSAPLVLSRPPATPDARLYVVYPGRAKPSPRHQPSDDWITSQCPCPNRTLSPTRYTGRLTSRLKTSPGTAPLELLSCGGKTAHIPLRAVRPVVHVSKPSAHAAAAASGTCRVRQMLSNTKARCSAVPSSGGLRKMRMSTPALYGAQIPASANPSLATITPGRHVRPHPGHRRRVVRRIRIHRAHVVPDEQHHRPRRQHEPRHQQQAPQPVPPTHPRPIRLAKPWPPPSSRLQQLIERHNARTQPAAPERSQPA